MVRTAMKPAAMLAVLLLAAVPTPSPTPAPTPAPTATPMLCWKFNPECRSPIFARISPLIPQPGCVADEPDGWSETCDTHLPRPHATPHTYICVGDAFDDDLGYIACTRITPSPRP